MSKIKNKAKTGAKTKTEKKTLVKNKRLLIIGVALGAVMLIGGITTAVILVCNNSQQEQPKETVVLNDNLEFEINSEVKISALVSEENTVNVLNEDEAVNTSSLGEQEVVIRYEVDGSEETATAIITIVDTKPPVIEYQKELTTTVGAEIDLLKDVKVIDNSKEEIKATIEGDYDFNKEGSYSLKYVATDKSGNKAEEVFTLTVNKKPTTTSSSGSNTTIKPSTSSNSTSGNTTSTNNGNTMSEKCQKSQEEFQKLMGKVYTSIPSNNPDINWSSAKIYVTKEAMESGGTRYTMHNEKIYGKNIGQSHLADINQLLGPLSEMRYTEANPLIIYVPNSWFCSN